MIDSSNDNEGIHVSPAPACLLCGGVGHVLWSGLRDRLYEAPGSWSLRSCGRCKLGWLDPRPLDESIPDLYAGYYTHANASTDPRWGRLEPWVHGYVARRFGYSCGSKIGGQVLRALPWSDDLFGGLVNWLPARPGGRLLDVGCGNGSFLLRMRGLGWDVAGVEPDATAAGVAHRSHGLDVRPSVSDGFEPKSFDAITLNHVIEHVSDPVGFLRTIASLLRPDGRAVIVTPNMEGLGARVFGSHWLHWDPPRHLFVFGGRSLQNVVERAGLSVERRRTAARYARSAYAVSRSISSRGSGPADREKPPGWRRRNSLLFQLAEHVANSVWWKLGEEVVLIARPVVGEARS